MNQTTLNPVLSWRQFKWLNSDVRRYEGSIADIRNHIPEFDRRSFGLIQMGGATTRLNKRLDAIVRKPIENDKDFVPVGIVSKDYIFISHIAVVDVVTQAFEAAQIDPANVTAELMITEYGERMALRLLLPEKYQFDPGDGNPMALRLECLNSVDGSTRFRVLMGWFRFVCSNGLVIGVTRADVRCRHVGDLQLDRVSAVLTSGLKESEKDKKCFGRWRKKEITLDQLTPWVEKALRKAWGFKAATRTFHIARCGSDVEVAGPYKDHSPTTVAVRETKHVPGAPAQCGNLFDVSQILAWLAKERRDLQEQLEWREQIPCLINNLLN